MSESATPESGMPIVASIAELRGRIADWRARGETVALVPTMGNLHPGHLALVDEARRHADRVVASVFVNPLQFGPNEDFDRYPRTLTADAAALSSVCCDLLFAPAETELYPGGRSDRFTLCAPALGRMLEGEFRPGFFDGVATVVLALFNIVGPDVAVFGQKDYQQLQIIRRLVADLHLPVCIVGVPTHREPDGLARSSRNQYLSQEQRAQAPALYRALCRTAAALRAGRRDYPELSAELAQELATAGLVPQYCEIRQPDLRLPDGDATAWVILVAAFLGETRLIDNLVVTGAPATLV